MMTYRIGIFIHAFTKNEPVGLKRSWFANFWMRLSGWKTWDMVLWKRRKGSFDVVGLYVCSVLYLAVFLFAFVYLYNDTASWLALFCVGRPVLYCLVLFAILLRVSARHISILSFSKRSSAKVNSRWRLTWNRTRSLILFMGCVLLHSPIPYHENNCLWLIYQW